MSNYGSWVDVANSSLTIVGAPLIGGFPPVDTTPNARTLFANYALSRDAVLEMAPWKSVTQRAVLASSSVTPLFNYSFYYPVPSDFVRLVAIYPLDTSYKVEGRNIACSNSTCNIRYVANSLPVSAYTNLLLEAIAAHLAWKVCFKLTQNASLKGELWRDFETALEQARAVDGKQQSVEQMDATYFLDSRLAGTVYGTPFNPSEE